MADENKLTGVHQKTDYAGPPKSHSFTGNLPDAAAQETPATPAPVPVTEPVSEEELIDTNAHKSDLLNQILESEPKPKPPKKPLFDFHFDKKILTNWDKKIKTFLEENKILTQTLQVLWMIFKSAVYIGGISFFAMFLIIYFGFTPILRSYLDSKGLQDVSFTVSSHNLSQITLTDIADKKGAFKIKTIRLQYTFTDLLKGKITLVDVDTMDIYIKDNQKDGFNVKDVAETFWKLGLMERNPKFQIQSLQLKNSKIIIGNNDYQIPIDFSGIGELEKKNHFVIPFTIKNQYLTAAASLDTQMSGNTTTWTVTLEKGRLTLPDQPAETVNATITWKTRNLQLTSFSLDGSILTEGEPKTLTLSVVPLSGDKMNIDIAVKLPIFKSDKPFYFNASIKNAEMSKDLRSLKTTAPLNLKFTNVQTSFIQSEIIQATLNGTLSCQEDDCTYTLQKPSDLILFGPVKDFYETKVDVLYPLRMTLAPNDKPLLKNKGGLLTYSAIVRNTTLNLRKKKGTEEPKDLKITLGNSILEGTFDFIKNEGILQTASQNVSYTDNVLTFEKADIKTTTDKNGTALSIKTPQMSLVNMPIFKLPFSIDFVLTQDQYFQFTADTINKQISVAANGYYNAMTGEILTALKTKPILFKKGAKQPAEISSLFEGALENVTGSVTLKGEIDYKNERNISGPLSAMIENASFDYGNVSVKNLNTVLTMSSLLPFGTQGVQNAYAEEVTAALPLQNVEAGFYFDSARKQFNISLLDVTFAGKLLRVDPSWFIYQSPLYTFNFKSRPLQMEELFEQTTLSDLKVTGTGTLQFALQLENKKVMLKNLELQVPNDGSIQYTPKVMPNQSLEIFKNLPFRRASMILNEMSNGTTDFLLIAERKNVENRKRTSIRFNLTEPIRSFIKPQKTKPAPAQYSQQKEGF